jgi:hypothetical protein
MPWVNDFTTPMFGFVCEPNIQNNTGQLTQLRAANTTGHAVRVRFFNQVFEDKIYPVYEYQIDPATGHPKIDPATGQPYPPVFVRNEIVHEYKGDVIVWETDFANGSTRQNSARTVPPNTLVVTIAKDDNGNPIPGQYEWDTGFAFISL